MNTCSSDQLCSVPNSMYALWGVDTRSTSYVRSFPDVTTETLILCSVSHYTDSFASASEVSPCHITATMYCSWKWLRNREMLKVVLAKGDVGSKLDCSSATVAKSSERQQRRLGPTKINKCAINQCAGNGHAHPELNLWAPGTQNRWGLTTHEGSPQTRANNRRWFTTREGSQQTMAHNTCGLTTGDGSQHVWARNRRWLTTR